MAEVLDLLLDEEALLQLQLDAGVLKQGQHRVKMLEMLFMIPREDDHVVKVHEAHLPPYAREDHVKSSLERRRGIAKTKRHPCVTVRADMTRERRLVAIFLGDGYLPVSPQRIEHREDFRMAQAIDAVVHPRERVRVRDRRGVETAEVDAEPHRAVLLGRKQHRTRPLGLRRLDDASLELILDLLADALAFLGSCPVRLLTDRGRARLQLDVMLDGGDRTQVTGEHGFVLPQDTHDATAKRGMTYVRKIDLVLPATGINRCSPRLRRRRRPRRGVSTFRPGHVRYRLGLVDTRLRRHFLVIFGGYIRRVSIAKQHQKFGIIKVIGITCCVLVVAVQRDLFRGNRGEEVVHCTKLVRHAARERDISQRRTGRVSNDHAFRQLARPLAEVREQDGERTILLNLVDAVHRADTVLVRQGALRLGHHKALHASRHQHVRLCVWLQLTAVG